MPKQKPSDQFDDTSTTGPEAPAQRQATPKDQRQPLTFPHAGKKPIAKWGPPPTKGA